MMKIIKVLLLAIALTHVNANPRQFTHPNTPTAHWATRLQALARVVNENWPAMQGIVENAGCPTREATREAITNINNLLEHFRNGIYRFPRQAEAAFEAITEGMQGVADAMQDAESTTGIIYGIGERVYDIEIPGMIRALLGDQKKRKLLADEDNGDLIKQDDVIGGRRGLLQTASWRTAAVVLDRVLTKKRTTFGCTFTNSCGNQVCPWGVDLN